jgi:hypothetical protein
MATTPIRIRVGASLDSSVDEVFGSIEKRAKKAAEVVARTNQKSQRETVQQAARVARGPGGTNKEKEEAKQKVKAAKDEERAKVASARAEDRAKKEAFRNRMREMKEEARQRRDDMKRNERARKQFEFEMRQMGREHEREEAKRARTAERMRRRALGQQKRQELASSREVDRFATRASHRFTRFLAPNLPILSTAKRVAGDIVRGIGVDTSVSSSLGRSVDLEKQAVALSNQGLLTKTQDPTGRNTTRVSAKDLMAEVRSVGTAKAFDPAELMAGLGKFTDFTGDLKSARETMAGIADLAGATGSSFEELMQAAGGVSKALGDIPNKGTAVLAIMNTLAGQAKVGSVEMRDMAHGITKITAASGMFGGSRAQNVAELGALAQAAMEGGASSADEALNAVSRFSDAQTKSARVSAFKSFGINPYTDDTNTKLRSPLALLKDSLTATGGDQIKMMSIWGSTIGQKATRRAANVFTDAGGGEAGLAAVDKMFEPLLKAALNEQTIAENNAERLKTTAAKVQQFQNNLDKIVATTADKVLPAFEEMAPKVLKLTEALGGLVEWAAKNPLEAAFVGIGAAAARAISESILRAGIDRALTSALNSSGAAGVASGVSGAAGRAGSAVGGIGALGGPLGIAAAIATTVGIGALTDEWSAQGRLQKGEKVDASDHLMGSIGSAMTGGGIVGMASRAWHGGSLDDIMQQSTGFKLMNAMFGKDPANAATSAYQSVGGNAQGGKVNEDAIGRAAGASVADAIASRTVAVRVTNPKDIGLGTPGGREPN